MTAAQLADELPHVAAAIVTLARHLDEAQVLADADEAADAYVRLTEAQLAHLIAPASDRTLEAARDYLIALTGAAGIDHALDAIDAELDLREFEAAAFGPNEVRR